MRKIVTKIIAVAILSATTAVPAFADGWGGRDHDGGIPGGPLWPIVAVASIPAAVIDTVVHIAFPFREIGYPGTPVTTRTGAYTGPADFSPAAQADYAPAPCYTSREYVAPRGYYEPRGYYRERGYRTYRGGW